jgi:hypothetical protein
MKLKIEFGKKGKQAGLTLVDLNCLVPPSKMVYWPYRLYNLGGTDKNDTGCHNIRACPVLFFWVAR